MIHRLGTSSLQSTLHRECHKTFADLAQYREIISMFPHSWQERDAELCLYQESYFGWESLVLNCACQESKMIQICISIIHTYAYIHNHLHTPRLVINRPKAGTVLLRSSSDSLSGLQITVFGEDTGPQTPWCVLQNPFNLGSRGFKVPKLLGLEGWEEAAYDMSHKSWAYWKGWPAALHKWEICLSGLFRRCDVLRSWESTALTSKAQSGAQVIHNTLQFMFESESNVLRKRSIVANRGEKSPQLLLLPSNLSNRHISNGRLERVGGNGVVFSKENE